MMTPAPATMGRQQLWAMIRSHSKDHLCAYCVAWELRWTRAEVDFEREFSHEAIGDLFPLDLEALLERS